MTSVLKRSFVGRPVRSDKIEGTLLPKKIALPVFASDALSSVSYATEEILLVLTLGGLSFIHFTWWVAVGVIVLMLTVVASYRQNVHAYPSGGGDYEVATTNLGPKFGLTVASALLVDYVLTVAVSTSAGVANFISAVPGLAQHRVLLATLVVARLVAPERLAARLGDRLWRERIERVREIATETISRHGGQPIALGGEDISARFDGTARAVRCTTRSGSSRARSRPARRT